MRNTRRRPTRSARRPETGSRLANPMKNTDATQDRVVARDEENVSEILPNARFVAVVLNDISE
jgi:hypothetical protein